MNNLKKKNNLPSSLIVTQSNHLVEARYNLSLGEQRLILAMISQIQPNDEDFKPYQISIAEFADFIGVSKNSMYQECQKITKKLLSRVVEINESNGLLQTGWVSSAKYIDGSGIVNLAFDPLLKPYLLQLKGNFTSCKFDMLLSFKSQYTMRMYTLLKQYECLKERKIELQQLRYMLGIRKNQYALYSNLKKNVLEFTKNELSKKSDLYFEFDEIKYGRKVGAICFRIISKKYVEAPTVDISSNVTLITPEPFLSENQIKPVLTELTSLVPEQHKTKKTVQAGLKSYEKKHGFDYVKRNILYSNSKADKSYAGFLNKSLKDDWGHDWELEQKEVPVKEVWERQGFTSEKEYNEIMYRKQMKNYNKKPRPD